MTEVEKKVNKAFRKITEIGYFDVVKGNEPIVPVLNKSMDEIPTIMTEQVNGSSKAYGCCFVFSACMIEMLKNDGVNAHMVASVEGEGIRASVIYQDGNEFYIANPVEHIEYFTAENIAPEDRKNYYVADTCKLKSWNDDLNHSRFTLDEFVEKYGKVWLFGYPEKSTTLNKAMISSYDDENCIAPPDSARFDVKKLIR